MPKSKTKAQKRLKKFFTISRQKELKIVFFNYVTLKTKQQILCVDIKVDLQTY